MKPLLSVFCVLLLVVVLVAACGPQPSPTPEAVGPDIANPASEYCVQEVPREVMRISSSASGSLMQQVSWCSNRLFCWSGAFFLAQGFFEEQASTASAARVALQGIKASQ